MKVIKYVAACLTLLCLATVSHAQLKVFIKLDDFGVLKNNNMAITMDSIIARKLKAGIGVIAKRLNDDALSQYEKYLTATNHNGEKLIEVWHHGYDHSSNNPPANNQEFRGTPYEFQQEHLKLGNELVKQKLGVQMHTFGSPFNGADDNTVKALQQSGSYKVFLLKRGVSGYKDGILYLDNEVRMENGTGNVNYDFFVTQYLAQKEKYKDFIVLQGHPFAWDKNKLADFLKIIDHLKKEGAVFMLPYEYYLSIKR